ncbi:hypothetical protein GCM10009828_068440 [Actinoplanes couchii]|uniref:Uncharacterized protein n=1 Tax=Actinoplanes couchii TaxID=403638 RepID=A0ABQ3X5B3_9ACTN|nr:hypothetical protein Aco03nite_021140 [Actinoplanes couchii]
MAGLKSPDRITCSDRIPRADVGGDRLVGGPQPTGMRDTHHAPPGEPLCEDDGAGPRGPHHRPGRGGQIDTPVPGQPGLIGRIEGPGDRGGPHRPDEDQRQEHGDDRHAGKPARPAGIPRLALWTAADCGLRAEAAVLG